MKPHKTRSKHILKMLLSNMVKSFWKSLKNTHKVHRNKCPIKYFNYVSIVHNVFDKEKNSFQKDFSKHGLILTFQKFITIIWLKFH
jgi:hypothetical protein